MGGCGLVGIPGKGWEEVMRRRLIRVWCRDDCLEGIAGRRLCEGGR